MIPPEEATGVLAEMYAKVRTPHGSVDNVMRAHSLRPRTMEGHVVLYRSVLHNPDNTLPFWFLEVVACYTSIVNRCAYSLTHHFENVRKLLKDETRARAIRAALDAGRPEDAFAGKELALLRYTRKLTAQVGDIVREDVEAIFRRFADEGAVEFT